MLLDEVAVPPRFERIYRDASEQRLEFNVMPGKPVREDLHLREYRVAPGYIECHLDRSYRSSMERSPSHFIFVSGLVHLQKMVYIYCCYHFGLDYEPGGRELMKIWPTEVSARMPQLHRDEQGLVQRTFIDSVAEARPGMHLVKGRSDVGPVEYSGTVAVFLT